VVDLIRTRFCDSYGLLVTGAVGLTGQAGSGPGAVVGVLRPGASVEPDFPGKMAEATRAARERKPMPVRFQLVIDCADPDRLARFWAAALGYELAPPPAGFPTWNDYYRDLGIPEEDLAVGADRISDPQGHGPPIWFQVVLDTKAVKNRLHLDIHASGERTDPIETRRQRVDAEASRLAGLGATITCVLSQEGLDHYAVGMKDPEGNEFDIN